jgi:asparagine synthase (glutamine-hydrolysing)
MCGICGVVRFDGAPVDPGVLQAMSATLRHRGPDSGGVYLDGPVALAARRLAVIDVEGGDQPIANEDASIHVVQNGEIYNYRELRRRLEPRHRFTTRSDTEVLVHLYEERGPAFVDDLRGMFAIALWDARRRLVVLARDRFGIKPLYYRLGEDALSFASELKALLRQPGFSRELDRDALEAFLAFSFVPGPLTIFSEAKKLPPGCRLLWDDGAGGDVRVERYARPGPLPAEKIRSESDEELASELRERLRDSVRAHLIADVPVGVLLSGGIDSSTIAALAALESSQRISTFSIGFRERGFDERSLARLVAERYDTDHHELVLDPDAAELVPSLADVFDEPFADSSAIPTYLVSKLARSSVKVALSGEGGDELFGGYNYYVGHAIAPSLAPAAAALRPLVERLPASTRSASSLDRRAKRFVGAAHLPPAERHYAWKTVVPESLRAELLEPDQRGSLDPVRLVEARYSESEGASALDRVMDVDLGLFLVDDMLVKTDRASMAHSLEARVPMLDPVVAELAFALPNRLKVRGFSRKRLIRRAVQPLLPAEILRGKKRGFSIPLAAWLRGDLKPFARDTLARERLRRQGVFRPERVTALLDEHDGGRLDRSREIWALLTFSLWFDRYASSGTE